MKNCIVDGLSRLSPDKNVMVFSHCGWDVSLVFSHCGWDVSFIQMFKYPSISISISKDENVYNFDSVEDAINFIDSYPFPSISIHFN